MLTAHVILDQSGEVWNKSNQLGEESKATPPPLEACYYFEHAYDLVSGYLGTQGPQNQDWLFSLYRYCFSVFYLVP